MKKIIAHIFTRLFYYAGDFVCKIVDFYFRFNINSKEDGIYEKIGGIGYILYCRLMNISADIDEWGDVKFWGYSK